ncbi:CAP domain-containing protein [bacterium]|nr:CAP domain-containing protein [candidate division CSSED10-310 bacterium]
MQRLWRFLLDSLIIAVIFSVLGSPGRSVEPEQVSMETGLHSLQKNDYITSIEQLIFQKTNEERAARGAEPMPALQPDLELSAIARQHSTDMLSLSFFSHENPDGHSYSDRMLQNHRRAILLATGENIWKQSKSIPGKPDEVASEIVASWMRSIPHRRNILSQRYTHLGVGVAMENDTILATQDFAGVLAYLAKPLPETVRWGDRIDVSISEKFRDLGPLEKFDFFDPDTARVSGKSSRIVKGRVKVSPGRYLLRLYFRNTDANGWVIYKGPAIQVE